MIAIYSIVVFVAYVVFIARKYGVQLSISETARTLGKNRWMFSIWLWLWLFPLLLIAPNDLWYLAIMVEIFVGAAVMFWRHKLESTVHIAASVGGIALGLISVGLAYGFLWVLWVLFVMALFAIGSKNKIWWVEVIAFLGIVLPLIFNK